MTRLLLALLVAAALAGCTSTRVSQTLASGATGCAPNEIAIDRETRFRGMQTFQATCKGVAYACTYQHPSLTCKVAQ